MLPFLGRIKAARSSQPLSLLKCCYYTTPMSDRRIHSGINFNWHAIKWMGRTFVVGGFSAACLGVGVATGLWAIAS